MKQNSDAQEGSRFNARVQKYITLELRNIARRASF